jgi:hypothetical protein
MVTEATGTNQAAADPAIGRGDPHLAPGAIVPRGTDLAPPPPGVRHVSVPWVGIVIANDELRSRIDRAFHWPMIVLALLILPLLVIDLIYFQRHLDNPAYVPREDWVFWAIRIGFATIWLAFLVEFIVKISIAESRVQYVRKNWLDVIIIAVPILRPLRAAAIAKTSRVFTLRGVGFKVARYVFTLVIGMEATERFLERVGVRRDARPAPRTMTRHDLVDEVKRLRRLTDDWEHWYDREHDFLREHGGADGLSPPPGDGEGSAESAESAESRTRGEQR